MRDIRSLEEGGAAADRVEGSTERERAIHPKIMVRQVKSKRVGRKAVGVDFWRFSPSVSCLTRGLPKFAVTSLFSVSPSPSLPLDSLTCADSGGEDAGGVVGRDAASGRAKTCVAAPGTRARTPFCPALRPHPFHNRTAKILKLHSSHFSLSLSTHALPTLSHPTLPFHPRLEIWHDDLKLFRARSFPCFPPFACARLPSLNIVVRFRESVGETRYLMLAIVHMEIIFPQAAGMGVRVEKG